MGSSGDDGNDDDCIKAFNWQQNYYATATGYTEVIVLFFSMVASFKHFRAAGSKISSVAFFHGIHTLFCICFVCYHLLITYDSNLCLCDVLNLISPLYVLSFIWTCSLFQKFWFNALRKPNMNNNNKNGIHNHRIPLYFILSLSYLLSFMYGIFQQVCLKNAFFLWKQLTYILFVIVAIDSTILSFTCLNKYLEYKADNQIRNNNLKASLIDSSSLTLNNDTMENNDDNDVMYDHLHTSLNETETEKVTTTIYETLYVWITMIFRNSAFKQTFTFILISLSMWIGVILNFKQIFIFFIFTYIIPSILMLILMWKRRYIKIISEYNMKQEKESILDNSRRHDSSDEFIRRSFSTDISSQGLLEDRNHSLLFLNPSMIENSIMDNNLKMKLKNDENNNMEMLSEKGGLKLVKKLKSKFIFELNNHQKNNQVTSNVTPIYKQIKNNNPNNNNNNPTQLNSFEMNKEVDDRLISSYFISIEESLSPPNNQLTMDLTLIYLNSIIIPNFEFALKEHIDSVQLLLHTCFPFHRNQNNNHNQNKHHHKINHSNSNPSSSNSLRMNSGSSLYDDLEKYRQYDDIVKKCDEITHLKYYHHISLFKLIVIKINEVGVTINKDDFNRKKTQYNKEEEEEEGADCAGGGDNGDGGGGGGGEAEEGRRKIRNKQTIQSEQNKEEEEEYLLKPSKEKSNNLVTCFATNLNFHHSYLYKRNNENPNMIISERRITAVTYGAPTAHSLGYKNGGLKNIMLKLISFNSKLYNHHHQNNNLNTPNAIRDKNMIPSSPLSPSPTLPSPSLPLSSPSLSSSSLSSPTPIHQNTPESVIKQLDITYEYHARKSIILSQALSAMVITSIDLLTKCIHEKKLIFLKQYIKCGILLHSISLLSTQGKELFMIDDFASAYELLKIKLKIIPPSQENNEKDNDNEEKDDDNNNMSSGGDNNFEQNFNEKGQNNERMGGNDLFKVISIEQRKLSNKMKSNNNNKNASDDNEINNNNNNEDDDEDEDNDDDIGNHFQGISSEIGNVTVVLRINSLSKYNWIVNQLNTVTIPDISIHPVLFNLGVNEMQSVANATGTTESQTIVNRRGLIKMKTYANKFIKFYENNNNDFKNKDISSSSTSSSGVNGSIPSTTPLNNHHHQETSMMIISLLKTLYNLIEEEANNKGKLIDLLLVSCYTARLLNGARTTSCKSAKDRTSVFHTLEVTRLMERDGWIDRCHEQNILDQLRGYNGVRLKNCLLNIGKAKYSFNSVQIRTLPSELRPPPITAASGET